MLIICFPFSILKNSLYNAIELINLDTYSTVLMILSHLCYNLIFTKYDQVKLPFS